MVFKDRIAPKERKSSKTFAAPTKDQAFSGKFMAAGDDYGVGFAQPIGTTKETSKLYVPQESRCFSPNDLNHD